MIIVMLFKYTNTYITCVMSFKLYLLALSFINPHACSVWALFSSFLLPSSAFTDIIFTLSGLRTSTFCCKTIVHSVIWVFCPTFNWIQCSQPVFVKLLLLDFYHYNFIKDHGNCIYWFLSCSKKYLSAAFVDTLPALVYKLFDLHLF